MDGFFLVRLPLGLSSSGPPPKTSYVLFLLLSFLARGTTLLDPFLRVRRLSSAQKFLASLSPVGISCTGSVLFLARHFTVFEKGRSMQDAVLIPFLFLRPLSALTSLSPLVLSVFPLRITSDLLFLNFFSPRARHPFYFVVFFFIPFHRRRNSLHFPFVCPFLFSSRDVSFFLVPPPRSLSNLLPPPTFFFKHGLRLSVTNGFSYDQSFSFPPPLSVS